MKNLTIKLAFLAMIAFAIAGCDKGSSSDKASGKDKPAAESKQGTPKGDDHGDDDGDHAAAGVVPGSHEDWCAEHAVPESQCTKCNPKLIPAFQATNDWCGEHGLPESQCTKCNPDLVIARPPKKD